MHSSQTESSAPLYVLRAQNITKTYRSIQDSATTVLRSVSMEVQRGEIVAITGASGAGKSTLLHILSTLDTPDTGVVEFLIPAPVNDTTTALRCVRTDAANDNELAALRNQAFGFIFQFHHLLPEFTALENVMMPALIAGVAPKAAQQRAAQLLQDVGVEHRAGHKPDALSGGEQQRVAFARALVNNPALVFADEPTGNLDSANSTQLLTLIQHIRHVYQQTFIIVTHSNELARSADRILRLEAGALIAG